MDELVTEHPYEITQIRLPMAGNPMRYVNAYVLRESDGLTLIDCGWKANDVRAALDLGLAAIGVTIADVRRLLVTHAHFDHYGLAATLRREGVPALYLHEADARFAQTLLADPKATDRAADAWIARHGMRITAALEDDVHFSRTELALPTHLPRDDERIGRLRAIHTPGHTPGHLCFLDERSGRMFTGDHVLGRVTPHVGVWFAGLGDPLGDYVASLRKVRAIGASGVFPAHGEPFDDLVARVDALLLHHDQREAQIEATFAASPLSAMQIASAIGWTKRNLALRDLSETQAQFAVAETIAHLDHLAARNRVMRVDDGNAIAYERVANAA